MFNTKYVGVSAEVNVYTPEIIIADSAGFEKNYEDQVLLILTATKKTEETGGFMNLWKQISQIYLTSKG